MKRIELLNFIVEKIVSLPLPHPTRVAIDGVDGVGKTTFANELAEVVRRHNRPVIRASVDGFHNPRAIRYRLGRHSPEGFFQDSYNYPALKSVLLNPLGPGGNRIFCAAIFDHRADCNVPPSYETAAQDAILLFDGIFLHRPETQSCWDISIFLDAPFEVTIARCAQRDGSSPNVKAPENRRYVEGQVLYLQSCEPRKLATIVINYADLESTEISKDRPSLKENGSALRKTVQP